MKNFRYLLAGTVAGGAFGAKIGGYLSTVLELSAAHNWIESGFVYGALTGMLTVTAFLIAFAAANYQKNMTNYSSPKMANA